MKKDRYSTFLFNFLVFVLLVPLVLMAFNYFVDPNHRYHFSVSSETLTRLARSPELVLTTPRNYDDRALLKKFIPVSAPPRILVMGGSRVMNIQPEMFNTPGLLNTAVMAGTIRDYVALWQIVKQSGFRPEIILNCVEEQSINRNSQNNRYLAIAEYFNAFYDSGLSLRQNLMGVMTNLKDLLSFETTSASIKTLGQGQRQNPELAPRKSYDPSRFAKTHVFSLLYPAGYEIRAPAVVNPWGRANGEGEIKVFEKWNPLDRRGYNHLTALIRDIKKQGGKPVLVGMPYHPEAYQMIRAKSRAYSNLLIFVSELRKIAEREGIFFYDAIEEHHAEFEGDDFLDGVHLKMTDNYRLFRNVDQAANLDMTSPDFRADESGRVVRANL